MILLSIRSALTVFFFVIFGIACSIPVAVVIELTKTTIDSSVIQLSVEVSDVMALSLDQDFSRGSVSTMGIVNWTHIHGDPQQNANARKFFMNRLMTASGGFYKNSWTSAFFRFGILGGIGFITKPVTGALLLQSCQSQNGFWNSTITSPSILDVYTSCDLLAYNETTLEVFPSSTSFVSPVPTLSRSFVNGPWLWNATVDLIAAARADGTLQRDSYVGFTPLYVELINAQGYGISGALYSQSSITYLQGQPTQPTALALSGLFVADFTVVLQKLLPPVPEARAFATDRFGRVAIFSHGNTVEIVTLASTGGRVYKDCVAGVYGRMACFYNISDHAPYALLRAVGIDELARIQQFQYNILHQQAGNNTSRLSLSERVMEATLSQRIDSSDGETFIVTHRPIASPVLDFGFTLHVFLPVEYFTSSITQARTIVIVVAIIISVIGLGLSYCFLLIVSDRIEELAESMKDPFAPKKRREQHQRVSRNRSLNGSTTRSSKSGTVGSTLTNDSCLKADHHEESATSGGAEVEQGSKQSGGRRNRRTTSDEGDNNNQKKKKKNKIKAATKEEKEIAQDLREKRKMDEMEKREQQYLSKASNNEEQQKGKTKIKEKKIRKSKKNNDNNEKSKNGTSNESEYEDAPRKNTNNIHGGKDDEEEVDEEEEEVEQIDEEEETEHWFRLEELCTLEKCFDDFRAVINTLRSFMPVSTALKRPSENKVAIEPSELPPATTTPIVVRKQRSAAVSKENGGTQNNQRSNKSMDSPINQQPQPKDEMGESSNDVPDALQETVANKNEQEDQQQQQQQQLQLPQESLPNISTNNSNNVIGDSINNENNVDNSNKNNSNFGARTVAAVSGSRTPPATPTRSLLKNKSPSSVAGKNNTTNTSINIHNIHENHDNSNGNKKGSGDLPTPSEKSAKKSVQFAASVSLPNTSNDEIEQRNNDGSKKRSPKASAERFTSQHPEGDADKNNNSHIDSDQSDGDVPNNHTKHSYSNNKNMENNNTNNNKSIMKKSNSSAAYPSSSPARSGQDMLDEFQRPVLKHRMLFAVVNIVGASACATEVAHFEANELQSQPRQQTSQHEDSTMQQHQRKMSSSYDSSSQSFVSWAQRMQVSPRQAFVRRAEFIVETILKVIHSTGAHLVEYRGDFFLICLRINRRPQSKLAFRFVQRLIKAADDIANHPLQKPFNIGVRKTVALTAGIAVGNVQVLNMMPDTTMVIHPVVADNNNNTLSETTPTNTTNGSNNSVSASGNLNRTDSFSQLAESSENQNNKINSPLQIKEFILARPLTFFGGCVSEVFAVERSLQEILFPVEYVSGSYESTATSFTISSTGGASSTAVATSENAVKLDEENHDDNDDNNHGILIEEASKQQHVIRRRDGSAGIALALCERRPNPKDQITIQTPVAPPSSSENSSTIEKNDNDSNNNLESNKNDRHVFPSAPSKMVDHTFVLSHAIAYCVPTTHDTLAILSQNIGSCIGSNFRVLNPEYEEPPEDEERRRREKVLRGGNTNCNNNDNKRRVKNRSSKTKDDNRLSLVQGEDVIGNDDDDFDEIDENNNNNDNDNSGPSFSPTDEHLRNDGIQNRQHPLITKTITTTTIVTDDGQEQETLTNVTFSGKQYSCENERILEELYFERFLKDHHENRKWIYCPPIARVVVAQQIGMIPVTVVVRTVTSEVNSHNRHSNKNLHVAEKKEESDSPATLNKRDLIKFNHGNRGNAKKNKNNSSNHHDDENESGPKQRQEQTTTGFYSYRKIQVQRPMLMPEILKKPVPGEVWSRSNNNNHSNNNNNNNCNGK